MGASKLRKSLDQEQATPRASFRRAGHVAPCDMGHFAREKGYKAASLRRAPWVRRLPGTASAPRHRKDCAPGRIFAICRFDSCDPIERIQNIYKAAIWRV